MAECITPFYVYDKKINSKIPVPCGRCPNCVSRRISGWSFRLMQEEKISESAYFVTLTYNEEHVPVTENGHRTVRKEDIQKFFKRLRKLHEKSAKIKYFAVAEYGGCDYQRPHYHILLFNAEKEKIIKAWRLQSKEIGHIHIGQLNEASIGYSFKYITKESRVPTYYADDRVKEFALMSKGLGKNYLQEKNVQWHLANVKKRCYITIKDGKKIGIPRYYKQKIYNQRQMLMINKYMKELRGEELLKEMEQYGDMYFHTKAEQHIQKFKKMHKKSKEDKLWKI